MTRKDAKIIELIGGWLALAIVGLLLVLALGIL